MRRKIIHGWQSHDRKANKKRSFVALAKKGCARNIKTACRISGVKLRLTDPALLFGFCVAAYRFSLVSPAPLCYALCLGTILFRPASYRSVPLRYALFLVPYRLVSFRRSSHACPVYFQLTPYFFPKGRYRAASFLSASPDPALFQFALYLVPHRPIPSSSVAPCSVFSRSVSSALHFPSSCLASSSASFRTGLYSSALLSFLFLSFWPFLFRSEAPSRISFP